MDESVLLAAGWALAVVSHARSLRARVTLARAAHEIRGPLCAAGLALAADRLDAVERELRRAGLAVADLDGARRARREAFDVAGLLRASEESWRSLAEAHGARLAVVAPREAWLRGDPERLDQAVANLVANAAEHGGGGEVRVEVETDGTRVCVVVADDGRGLPEGLARRLGGGGRRWPAGAVALERRRGRADDPRRGHGLAIAAAIARLNGGRLSHRPSAAGAVLVLDLPVRGASQQLAWLRMIVHGMSPRPLREALS